MTSMVKMSVARCLVPRYMRENQSFAAVQDHVSSYLGTLPYWDYVQENFRLEVLEQRNFAEDATEYLIIAHMTEQERTLFLLRWSEARTASFNSSRSF